MKLFREIMNIKVAGIFLLALLFSCNSNSDKEIAQPLADTTFQTENHSLIFDHFSPPVVISAGIPKANKGEKPIVKKAEKPISVSVNTNIITADKLNQVPCGEPYKVIPGKNGTVIPLKNTVINKVVPCRQPLPIHALSPHAKDDVINDIEYLNMDQGMNSNNINTIFEDKKANLWFGTKSNGVIKYDGKSFLIFTEEEGLSSNNINCIVEDKRGNIWFGTAGGGACMYNGKEFMYFTTKEGLSNNSVTSILEDADGLIWIGTNGGGVNIYDGEKISCFTKKNGLSDDIVLSIAEDRNGNIWLGTLYGGVNKYDGKSFSRYDERQGMHNNWVSTITEDSRGNLWFGHIIGGADKFDGKTFTHISEKDGLSSDIIVGIKEDKEGNIWFGTQNKGVCKYDGKTIVLYGEKEGLNDNLVNCIHYDKYGNIWVGTSNGGVNILRENSFVHYTNNDGLTADKVLGMAQDTAGTIWFAGWNGVSRYNGKSFFNYTEKEGLNSNHINVVFADSKGNIWFGTNERGVIKFDGKSFTNYTEKQGLSNYCITAISEDKEGNMWFGTEGVGVNKFDGNSFYHFTEKEGLNSNYITAIYRDKKDNLWFGTKTGNICKYDGKSFYRYSKKQGEEVAKINCFAEDNSGALWFGTEGDGAIKFDGKSFFNFSMKDGLSNDFVRSIFTDKEGKMWISTDRGINIISRNDNISNKLRNPYKILTKEEGLKDNRFLRQSVLLDKAGNAWWGGYESVTMLDLKKYVYPQNPPFIQLNSIELEQSFIDFNQLKDTLKKGGIITVGDSKNSKSLQGIKYSEVASYYNYPLNLELPYHLNTLTFNFSAIDWQAPHKLQYVYILEGFDKYWSPLKDENIASYRNLPSGKYNFKVNAIGIAGKWCDGFQYSFRIKAPWWQTWWFRVLEAAALILFLYSILLSRTTYLQKKQVLLQRIIRERTEDLTKQKMEVEKRNEIIEIKQKEILASINYAQRIQRSLLPPMIEVMEALPESFILFKPKDIVSGDFYWFSETEDKLLIAAADCTGHGVPGAFMSAICSEKLNEAVSQTDDVSTILQIVNIRMKKVLRQVGKEDLTHDGMDIALCSLNTKTNELEYAGANRPLWIIRNNSNEIEEKQPDKVSIGGFTNNEQLFTLHMEQLKKGDTVYLFTDGFADQFGVTDKKLMSKRFKEVILSIQDKSMGEQKTHLDFFIEKWKGNVEQTDDILVIGIRV